ncbi:hypothetical protein LTR37_015032 [Vermiconidia calcicola]|uniref:Uncharacterized protein n=1 Tax=Vermiconidia calcicola TaxID=1690605 RepID=A0ACC3MUL5_9PEZI|nr:hypothetical protein LTR37_015032 [Vermiconidia calcicola]
MTAHSFKEYTSIPGFRQLQRARALSIKDRFAPASTSVSLELVKNKRAPNCKLEVALVTVDSRCETMFEIPEAWLTQTSALLKRDYVNAFKSLNGISFDGFADQDSADAPQKKTVYLPNVYTSHFFDFQRWLRKGRILLTTVSHTPPWVVESSASRLVDANKLAIVLESKDYQKAAMNEFLWTAIPRMA